MADHFIDYINIERYKCFDDFSAKGFKRVNLIAGKNNVGKTALLEGLLLSASTENINDVLNKLDFIYICRNKVDKDRNVNDLLNNIRKIKKTSKISTNCSVVTYSFDDSKIPGNYNISLNGNMIAMVESSISEAISGLSGSSLKAAYISNNRDSQEEIINSFVSVQKKDRETEVNKIVSKFDESIQSIKVIGGNSIQCKVFEADGSSSYRELSEFGDGLRHYISIISDLFAVENKYLFIDEVDNGIHYSSLDDLWEIVLKLSKELNVQIFATTHSKECIEAYCRAAEKLQDKEITFTTLVKNKERAVKAIVRDYEVFTDSIRDEREVRGW